MKRNASAILLIAGLFVILVALNFIFFVEDRDDEENEQTGSRSSYRSTPYGTLAFYTLLEESGHPVTRLDTPLTELKGRKDLGTLLIIAPPARNNPTKEEFESLNQWVEEGGLLIVIDRDIRVDFGTTSAATEPRSTGSDAKLLQPTRYTRGVERIKLSEFATRVRLKGRAATYHIGDDQAAVLADLKSGNGRVVLLTDPYVVANNGISEADNVILALNLLAERPAGKIAFDEYHHGYGSSASQGIMSYFRGTPVPWMMGQTALIAAMVIYTYGRRFARPLPLKRERRTTNLEFVSSMANITRLARATDLAMQNIYSEFRRRLCRYSGLPANAETAKLASVAARRAKMNEGELRQTLARCEEVARGKPISDSELLSLVARIREIESRLAI